MRCVQGGGGGGWYVSQAEEGWRAQQACTQGNAGCVVSTTSTGQIPNGIGRGRIGEKGKNTTTKKQQNGNSFEAAKQGRKKGLVATHKGGQRPQQHSVSTCACECWEHEHPLTGGSGVVEHARRSKHPLVFSVRKWVTTTTPTNRIWEGPPPPPNTLLYAHSHLGAACHRLVVGGDASAVGGVALLQSWFSFSRHHT